MVANTLKEHRWFFNSKFISADWHTTHHHARSLNYGGDLAYAIAYKAVRSKGDVTYILAITARGSQTLSEYWKDFSTSATKDFLGYSAYDVVYDFEEEIWTGLSLYLKEHDFCIKRISRCSLQGIA